MNNGTSLLTRHEARSPAGAEALRHYAAGVGRMKERPDADPTSWTYQAAIHGTETSPLALQNQCEHESWFFFPWHRLFLYFFEQIVRQAVVETGGPTDWTLPYWNYDLGGENASLPEPFRLPADSSNPLFVPVRRPYYNAGGTLPDLIASEERALALREFTGNAMFGGNNKSPHRPRFWGQPGLPEETPHGTVHVEVGGWMRNPEEAAQDPIFWLHHANIDRIWAVWNEREGGANPTEGGWLTHTFEFFNSQGEQMPMNCGETNRTELLGYTYYPPPSGVAPAPPDTVDGVASQPPPPPPPEPSPDPGAPTEPKFVGSSEQPVTLEGEEAEVEVPIDPRAQAEVLEATESDDPRHLYVNVEEIRGRANPDTAYAMYLNLPESPSSSDYDSHYLSSLSFFGIERTTNPGEDEAPHGMRVSVEAGDVVKILRDDPDWDRESLRIRFRPVVPEPTDATPDEARELLESSYSGGHEPVEIGRISLAIDA
jgi:Common central domain of tyrosinase